MEKQTCRIWGNRCGHYKPICSWWWWWYLPCRCVCPDGFDGPRCQQTRHSFTGDGWAWFRSLSTCAVGKIRLEFATEASSGLLLYAGPMVNPPDGKSNIHTHNLFIVLIFWVVQCAPVLLFTFVVFCWCWVCLKWDSYWVKHYPLIPIKYHHHSHCSKGYNVKRFVISSVNINNNDNDNND